MAARKIVQIAVASAAETKLYALVDESVMADASERDRAVLFALTDDGTVWWTADYAEWWQCGPLPPDTDEC